MYRFVGSDWKSRVFIGTRTEGTWKRFPSMGKEKWNKKKPTKKEEEEEERKRGPALSCQVSRVDTTMPSSIVFPKLDRIELDFTGFCRVITVLYRILLSYSKIDKVVEGFTWFYWLSLGLRSFYWVLSGFTGFYWVLLGFTGFHRVFTGFYRILPGFTDFHWV